MKDQIMTVLAKEMGPEEFIRMYALRIFEEDALKLGLLLSCGDTMDQATLLIAGGDEDRMVCAVRTLVRLGYLKVEIEEVNVH